MDSKRIMEIKRATAMKDYVSLELRYSNLMQEAGTARTKERANELLAKADKLKEQMLKLHEKIIYKNEDKECDCSKCELQDTCNYKDKYQRFSRDIAPGALALCKKL